MSSAHGYGGVRGAVALVVRLLRAAALTRHSFATIPHHYTLFVPLLPPPSPVTPLPLLLLFAPPLPIRTFTRRYSRSCRSDPSCQAPSPFT